jgi:hypothetical protein
MVSTKSEKEFKNHFKMFLEILKSKKKENFSLPPFFFGPLGLTLLAARQLAASSSAGPSHRSPTPFPSPVAHSSRLAQLGWRDRLGALPLSPFG